VARRQLIAEQAPDARDVLAGELGLPLTRFLVTCKQPVRVIGRSVGYAA
jgi:hypothetical protein